ncbi:winged helix-turn-helix domain-containing protein [Streptomyces sp. NPDC003314]
MKHPRGTYLVVAASLRQEIEEGQGGDSLSSESELMKAYGVSRNTVRRALRVLESENLVTSIPGAGWRVFQGVTVPLVDRLIDVMSEDTLAVGDRYPSESELCRRFEVSRTAVRRALAQLEGSGLLHAIHGKGRFVSSLPSSRQQT